MRRFVYKIDPASLIPGDAEYIFESEEDLKAGDIFERGGRRLFIERVEDDDSTLRRSRRRSTFRASRAAYASGCRRLYRASRQRVALHTTRCRPSSTVPHSEDARGSFMLDRDVPNDIEFEVGQPVSVGLSQLQIGSRGTFLREVSIVRRGAVKGAEITKRHEIKETPPPPATKRTDSEGQIIYGGPLIRRNIGKVLDVR